MLTVKATSPLTFYVYKEVYLHPETIEVYLGTTHLNEA